MSDAAPRTGQLPTALATFIFFLNDSGNAPDDADLVAACAAVAGAGEGDDMDALGQALVEVIEGKIAGEDLSDVEAFLGSIYSADRLKTSLGDSREDRARNMRRYHFAHNAPWLAQVIDRFPDGTVGPHWVMVERVGETVTCADPYPWDDLDEEYDVPLNDFMVKWELLGCPSVRFE